MSSNESYGAWNQGRANPNLIAKGMKLKDEAQPECTSKQTKGVIFAYRNTKDIRATGRDIKRYLTKRRYKIFSLS